ncbi:alpha/beta hydrolase [Gracilinema caldarium]|uniref:alpha/beta hydrolase n=1 Tax=Gracilinema caldarium TaxID=215591 RepID=UPI0026EA0097|nr:alpha/beta hydrolase [Gracilinema caldarium]
MRRALLGVTIFIAIFSFVSCESINTRYDETESYRISLWNDVPLLSRDSGPPEAGRTGDAETEAVPVSPFAAYSRDFLANIWKTCEADVTIVYRYGWILFREELRRSADVQLFLQVLYRTDERPRGTVFLFHGYANDSSHMTGVAGALLAQNWAVVLTDLPGHGLSTGPRGDVEHFSDYGDTVQRVLDTILTQFDDALPLPLMAFGHSTGALALVDYSIRYESRFSRMVFYAPLIRSAWWNTARFGRALLGPFVRTTRAFAKSPLGLRVFPVHWFDSLVAWERSARKQQYIPLPPTRIIQPEKDDVVLSDYNARFLMIRAPRTELIRLGGLSHFATDARIPDRRLLDAIVDYFNAQ